MPTVPNSSPTTMTMRPLVTESPESVTAMQQAEEREREFFGRPEAQREFGDRRREEREADDGH